MKETFRSRAALSLTLCSDDMPLSRNASFTLFPVVSRSTLTCTSVGLRSVFIKAASFLADKHYSDYDADDEEVIIIIIMMMMMIIKILVVDVVVVPQFG